MIPGAKWKCYWQTSDRPQLGALGAKPRGDKKTWGQPKGATDLAPGGNTKGKEITKCHKVQIYLNLNSKITPSEIQDKVINLHSFCKTKGNKYRLSVQPFSLFSHPNDLSHVSSFSPPTLPTPNRPYWFRTERQRRSDLKQKQWERIGRIQETLKQQKQGYLNYLARSQP